jgi:hypothetical protein
LEKIGDLMQSSFYTAILNLGTNTSAIVDANSKNNELGDSILATTFLSLGIMLLTYTMMATLQYFATKKLYHLV